MDALPTDVLAAAEEFGIGDLATDTETSGLFADDGARVSTASIAWEDEHGEWAEWADLAEWAAGAGSAPSAEESRPAGSSTVLVMERRLFTLA